MESPNPLPIIILGLVEHKTAGLNLKWSFRKSTLNKKGGQLPSFFNTHTRNPGDNYNHHPDKLAYDCHMVNDGVDHIYPYAVSGFLLGTALPA